MNNLWDDYVKEIGTEQIAFAFDQNGCTPFYLVDNPIGQFFKKTFSDKGRLYDATIFLMTSCSNEGFWKMLQMIDTTIVLLAYDITVENVAKAKDIFPLNDSFKKVVGYPIYGNVALVAKKYLPNDLMSKIQKLEEKADPLF